MIYLVNFIEKENYHLDLEFSNDLSKEMTKAVVSHTAKPLNYFGMQICHALCHLYLKHKCATGLRMAEHEI